MLGPPEYVDNRVHHIVGSDAARYIGRETGLPLVAYKHLESENWILAIEGTNRGTSRKMLRNLCLMGTGEGEWNGLTREWAQEIIAACNRGWTLAKEQEADRKRMRMKLNQIDEAQEMIRDGVSYIHERVKRQHGNLAAERHAHMTPSDFLGKT